MSEPLSEVYELFDELKDRYHSWRRERTSRRQALVVEHMEEASDIEFTSLEPNASLSVASRRTFAGLGAAWIESQCAPGVFAQGRACYQHQCVTRVHALGTRMTGTTRGKGYEDQEILLRDGMLFASCSCERAASSVDTPSVLPPKFSAGSSAVSLQSFEAAPSLRCCHVVAVLLAYLHDTVNASAVETPARPQNTPAEKRDKLICPVTRQTLEVGQPLFQCRQCGMNYSAEGWKFLQQADKGRCCGCESRNTVTPVR